MNYIVESVSYECSDPFAPPIFSAEVRFLPKTRKDYMDLGEALCSTNYEDVSRLGLIFNSHPTLPSIKNVYFNDPATVVLWDDGTKTIVRCQDGDTYSKEVGLAMCIAKKALGNKGNYNDIFKKWIPEETAEDRFCCNCKHRYDAIADSDPCYSCDLSIHSNWKSDR